MNLSSVFIDLCALPEEVLAFIFNGFCFGSLLEWRCVSKKWDAIMLKCIELRGSLKVKRLPIQIPPLYVGKIQLCLYESGLVGEIANTETITNALLTYRRVTALHIRCNRISNRGAIALADIFRTNKYITLVDLSENQIRYEGAQALAEVLEKNSYITSMKLRNNSICPIG